MERLKNKVAFITGGTNGIGLATAKDFIEEGATVIITGRYRDTIDKTVRMLGPNAHGIVSDAGNMSDIFQLKEQVLQFKPGIDILFGNAGYGKFAAVEAVTEGLFDELFNVLVKGTFFTVQQLLPIINKEGSVILNTSVVTEYGSQNASIYSAAKASVQSLVKTLAAEFTSKMIRVNAVSPGYTEKDGFNKTGLTPEQITNTKQYVIPTLPLKRFADPSEIAKAVTFLASNDASYIHATEIIVDGGYTTIKY
jgi:NAD(P)-dependent dehydrogenase (short-subunit alcohol dehydrogenase family)